MAFDVEKYPSSVRELLVPERIAALDAGAPNPAARSRLAALRSSDLAAARKPADGAMAEACLAGLWLYHDFLSESHALSQEIAGATGSYWHALMHRREPDYDNSKYWFRQTGEHEAFEALLAAARAEFSRRPATAAEATRAFAPIEVQTLIAAPKWDPYRFVDLCEAATKGDRELQQACRTLQAIEWHTLFDYCFERAVR
ncbi:MAG: hypothetical protein K8U03_21315 [Planctomycetia bacterium]|nr:hypothetical protein [Planctomycetia bacterium]